MVFKVDFEKAFNLIRWDYLDDVLKKFGFGDKWCGWINGCLKSAKGSALVNGSPTPEFKFHKGLKQGDPLSPFLFILIMEILHLSFKRVMNAGLFASIPLDNSLTISYLFYTDDAIFVGKTIKAIHGEKGALDSLDPSHRRSLWLEIICEITILRSKEDITRLRFALASDPRPGMHPCHVPCCLFLPISTVRWERELDLCYSTFNILAELWPELPGHEDTIKNASVGKIVLPTNFSQLSVLGAAKNGGLPMVPGRRLLFVQFTMTIITLPAYWAALRNQSNAGFLDGFNINSAQHICMVSELRLWYEHEIMSRERFQKKFTDSSVVVQQRDAEIAVLKAKLEKAKSEATEVDVLHVRVSELETRVVARYEEVSTLNKQNAELLGKVSALESEREELNREVIKLGEDCESLWNEVAGKAKLREEFKSFQDVEDRHFEEKSAQLDARIVDVRCDMDNDLYPHMFTAIVGRKWVLSHVLRLAVMKCAQSVECRSALGRVEAYDLEVKNRYVVVVSDFENVSFTLLDELESLKDSPLASIMSALVLRDDQGIMPLSEVIPVVSVAAERKGLCPPSGSTAGEVSTFTLADDGVVLPPSPATVQPPKDDLFNTAILDKPADA
ncbi:gypsy type transposase [Tanacetum coccineum]